MSVTVRPVRPEEHAEVGELVVHSYVNLNADLVSADYEDELRDVADRAEKAEVYVAVDDAGTLLGSVTLVIDATSEYAEISKPDEAEFRMLAVHPDAQRAGVGRALVEHVVAESRARGNSALVLSSGAWMATAHRLYERLGFRRTPELDWEPVEGIRLVAYRLELP